MQLNRVLMVAAENDALPGAKVGGVGDVVRDIPLALAAKSIQVDIIVPSYGFLARLKDLHLVATLDVFFSGVMHRVELLKQAARHTGITQYILHHPKFAPRGETVYCDDKYDPPFSTDATKFAFFNACVAEALESEALIRPDVLHCHDWHSAFLFILKKYAVRYSVLRSLRTVYTIHNLAMQGLRPFKGETSSLESWFTDLHYDAQVICDRRYPDCVNPMRAGILLADKIHTVSPTYAQEILHPSNATALIYGGEGLEEDLNYRNNHQGLFGILNGCIYPDVDVASKKKLSKVKFVELCRQHIHAWAGLNRHLKSAHWLADKNIDRWSKKATEKFVVTSVGRITDQKVTLFKMRLSDGRTALEALLESLVGKGVFILMGSGSEVFENFFTMLAGKFPHFIFLNGYSDELSENVYRYGDLFLMPSSFEPCGISQMLAMREGQPCLVNAVGGLKDTVSHEETGFVFDGETPIAQADAFLSTFNHAMGLHQSNPDFWKKITAKAKATRFTWDDRAEEYIAKLYS